MKKYRRLAAWLIVLAALSACSGNDSVAPPDDKPECPPAERLTLDLPPGFPELPDPKDNRLTREGVALGRRLFYDPILSGDSSQACGTCHLQQAGFGDTRRFSEGIDGIKGNRQAPTIVNPGWQLNGQFWDGREPNLEGQATRPVPNPIEMHLPWAVAVERLKHHAEYPDLFCAAFGDSRIDSIRVVKAIAQFERTFVSVNSKYDLVRRGEDTFTPEEQAGYRIFSTEVGDCFHCHAEPLFDTGNFSSGTFRNTGLDAVPVDRGRMDVTGSPADIGQFKVPSLRNILESSPYMHDGRFATINEVLNHYNLGFHDGPDVDPLIRARLTRRPMRTGEMDTLIVFLQTLTDPVFLADTTLSSPYH
jgi:cytochrome c peroxidase